MMKAPVPSAASQVKMRWFFCDQFATRNAHIKMHKTKTRRRKDEIAVIKLWRRFGIEKAPMRSAVTAAAIKALVVVGVTSTLPSLPNVRAHSRGERDTQ